MLKACAFHQPLSSACARDSSIRPGSCVVRKLFKSAVLSLSWLAAGTTFASSSTNASSPLGINLTGIASSGTEQPFMNIFHNAGALGSPTVPRGTPMRRNI